MNNYLKQILLFFGYKIAEYRTYYVNIYNTTSGDMIRVSPFTFDTYEKAIEAVDTNNSKYIQTVSFDVRIN